MSAPVRLDDLTPNQRAVVLALIRAQAAADATKKATSEHSEVAKVEEGVRGTDPTT